jgi:hypothetical protein
MADPDAAVIITSCESDNHPSTTDDEDSSIEEVDEDYDLIAGNHTNHATSSSVEAFYDEHADRVDEAYVYQQLRGGLPESVSVRSSPADGGTVSSLKTVPMYRPRSSDAVLSCPCCFRIVCMDCQKHERYTNQYRAMFVMNIVVQWNEKLIVDPQQGRGLVPMEEEASNGADVVNNPDETMQNKEFYYKVCCDHCLTQVAALDMTDEVYHFFGCMASA